MEAEAQRESSSREARIENPTCFSSLLVYLRRLSPRRRRASSEQPTSHEPSPPPTPPVQVSASFHHFACYSGEGLAKQDSG